MKFIFGRYKESFSKKTILLSTLEEPWIEVDTLRIKSSKFNNKCLIHNDISLIFIIFSRKSSDLTSSFQLRVGKIEAKPSRGAPKKVCDCVRENNRLYFFEIYHKVSI